MSESSGRSRRSSFFQKLKRPFLGRLRRKSREEKPGNLQLHSPTSVIDITHQVPVAEDRYHENEETQFVDVFLDRKNQESNEAPSDQVLQRSEPGESFHTCIEGGKDTDIHRGQLLRDFSYSNQSVKNNSVIDRFFPDGETTYHTAKEKSSREHPASKSNVEDEDSNSSTFHSATGMECVSPLSMPSGLVSNGEATVQDNKMKWESEDEDEDDDDDDDEDEDESVPCSNEDTSKNNNEERSIPRTSSTPSCYQEPELHETHVADDLDHSTQDDEGEVPEEEDAQEEARNDKQKQGKYSDNQLNGTESNADSTNKDDDTGERNEGRPAENEDNNAFEEGTVSADNHDGAVIDDPIALFEAGGATVIVDIVKGTYENKQGEIIGVKKNVKVLLENTDSGRKEVWLPRTSLAYKGKPIPLADCKSDTNSTRTVAASSAPSQNPANQDFRPGEWVSIVGGTYAKYKRGKIIEVKTSVKIEVDGLDGKTPWLQRKSIRKMDSPTSTESIESDEDFNSCLSNQDNNENLPPSPAPGHRTDKAKTAPKRKVSRNKPQQPASAPKSRVRSDRNQIKLQEYLSENDWRVVDGAKTQGTKLGLRKLVKMRFEKDRPENTLLAYFLQNRLELVEIPISNKEIEVPIPKEFEFADGSKFELVVSKIQGDGDRPSIPNGPVMKCIQMYFCKTSGPGLESISLKDELERIADFGSLSEEKACARLELFVSPAYKFKPQKSRDKEHAIFVLQKKTFSTIDETGNEGCGFISEDFLCALLGGDKAAERATSIQVRGSSEFGMFKGILVKKKIDAGEPPIQIPPSMLVVGPSRASNPEERCFLVINRNGVHPNSTNEMVHRLLSGVGTTKTFRTGLKKKKLSDMIIRLWNGLGVSESAWRQYKKECLLEETLKHAYVVGCADPTSQLPPGTVFIPGLEHSGDIFVTRSPCIEASDGRKVPVVTTRPSHMSSENWMFLQSFSFGSIIFANPKIGELPMPVLIADGDLDGDLYFICWNSQILEEIKTEPLEPTPTDHEEKRPLPYRNDWLELCQDRMADAKSSQLLGQIIGKLWNAAVKIAKNSSDGFVDDEDFMAYANGYKQALKIGKHGGKIFLPTHLHSKFPEKFQCILTDVSESD